MEARAERLSARDWMLAAGLTVALAAFYRATFQERQYGDAALLVQAFLRYLDGQGQWGHVLYLPAARFLAWLLRPESPVEALRLLSSLGVAISAGCVVLLARLWGARAPAAVVAALLFAFAPGPWFFATTVEVHALHAACVGVCVLTALLAPWKRKLPAALLVSATIPLLFFSHQSGILLGVGFVLLARWGRSRSGGTPFSAAELWLVLAPLFLAAFVGAIAFAAGSLENSMLTFLGGTNTTVRTFERAFELGGAWDGWIVALGALTPLFLWALLSRRLRGPGLTALAGLVLPPLVFFVLWGLPERGGYALPSALLLAAAGALALESPLRGRWAIAAPLLALQVALGWTSLRAYDDPSWGERNALRRTAVAEALPDGGALISINIHSQYIEYQLHRVHEVSLYDVFATSARAGHTPEEFVRRCAEILEPWLDGPRALALDRDGALFVAQKAPQFVPLVAGLEDWLRLRLDFEPTTAAPTIVRLRRRPRRGAPQRPSDSSSGSRRSSGQPTPCTGSRRRRLASHASSASL